MEDSKEIINSPSKFSISAPGKVILHGEHSVVYGHLAIAASLNLRTKADFELLSSSNKGQQSTRILLPNINLDISLPSSIINQLVSLTSEGSWDFNQPHNVDFVKLVDTLQTFMTNEPIFKEIKAEQRLGLKCLLFLMIAIMNQPKKINVEILKSFELSVTSELPVGAGAGSSASYCVVLAGVFLCLAKLKADPQQGFYLDDKTKELISNWAFLGERITHGNPSGLDNSVCTFGSLIAFRRPNTTDRIPLHNSLRVLLVDTKVSRNTRTLVENVAKLRERHEITVKAIMEAMESISSEALQLFKLMDGAKQRGSKEDKVKLYLQMEELWSMNHSLLVALGVSHPSLEQIVQISKEKNLSAKLTGAGGGGFAIVLLPINSQGSETAITTLKAAFTSCGFDFKDVDLGGSGVQLQKI